jgi:hypothetical protein
LYLCPDGRGEREENTRAGVFSEQPDCGGGQFRHPVKGQSSLLNAEIYFDLPGCIYARMAELVDALVSNTSGSNAVPVRSRLRVQNKSESESNRDHSRFFLYPSLLIAINFVNPR